MKRRPLPLTVEIDPRDAAAWKKKIPPLKFAPGQILFYRGHLPYGILLIHSGTADLRQRPAKPRKSPFRVGPNTILGLSNLLAEEPYPLTAVVIEELEATFIERTLIASWVKHHKAPLPLPI